jgi:hypothetical protein
MATIRWKSGAAAVAQVQDYVFAGTWEATDVINMTIGNKVVTTTAGTATAAAAASAAVAAFNLSENPEFVGITASVVTSTTVRLTADDAGLPFICTIATTETGGGAADAQTIDGGASSTGTATTACSGPNHWDTAANWSSNTVPVNADIVIFENSTAGVFYGMAQSAVTLAELHWRASYTGPVGLPEVNSDEDDDYPEYRATYLAISATVETVGYGPGQGSGRIKRNAGSVQTALDIQSTGSAGEADLPAVIWKGTHAANTVNATSGSLGVAVYGGEVATILTLRVSGDAVVVCGQGVVTLTTLEQAGGDVTLYAGLTTVTKKLGSLTIWSGSVTTITDDEGLTRYLGVGTITTWNVGSGATAAFSADDIARGTLAGCTVTNMTLYPGSTLSDPWGRVTFSNGFRLTRDRWADFAIDIGVNRLITPS